MADIIATPSDLPAGWKLLPPSEAYLDHIGPFYYCDDAAGPGAGFFPDERHANSYGVTHGGLLVALADNAIFIVCEPAVGPLDGVTVSLNTEFLAPGTLDGGFIQATGEPTKTSGKLLMSRGLITQGGRTLMSFSGVIKRSFPSSET